MPSFTPVHQMRGQTSMQRRPLSLSYLKGVGPNEVPYSDEERSFARGRRADDLSAREEQFQEQANVFPQLRRGPSPTRESELFSMRAGPAWTEFFDTMADQPNLAAGRGMRGSADLAGQGVGTGTGFGRMKADVGEFDSSGSFRSTNGPAIDMEDLLADTRRPGAPLETSGQTAQQRTMAMRALDRLMRGR